MHRNTEHEREKGGLKPDTHKHELGVWLLLRTQPVRARFPRHNGFTQTKTLSEALVTGCEANTGNRVLSGTGETMIIDQKKKREENHRGAGSQGKTFFVKRNTGGQKETSVRG